MNILFKKAEIDTLPLVGLEKNVEKVQYVPQTEETSRYMRERYGENMTEEDMDDYLRPVRASELKEADPEAMQRAEDHLRANRAQHMLGYSGADSAKAIAGGGALGGTLGGIGGGLVGLATGDKEKAVDWGKKGLGAGALGGTLAGAAKDLKARSHIKKEKPQLEEDIRRIPVIEDEAKFSNFI